MVCFLVFLTLFCYCLNSVYPNELVTRMLLHLSILFLITKLMLNKVKISRKQKMSELAITSGIMMMIPVVFLSFGAQFVGVYFSSTRFIFSILISTFLLYSILKIKENKQFKTWSKQLLRLSIGRLRRKI